jgi:hypothetical protein
MRWKGVFVGRLLRKRSKEWTLIFWVIKTGDAFPRLRIAQYLQRSFESGARNILALILSLSPIPLVLTPVPIDPRA